MRILAVMLIASCAAAQTPQTKPPTYTTEPVTHQVAHCEAGWHLETWHYGNDQTVMPVYAIYSVDPSGYRAADDFPLDSLIGHSSQHPDRCVKDETKK